MYQITLKTWYQETPDKHYYEHYHGLEFESIELAVEYLAKHIDKILEWFPTEGINIEYKKQ